MDGYQISALLRLVKLSLMLIIIQLNSATYQPVILVTIYYVGTADEAAQYLGPYNAIGPVSVQNDSIPYPEVAEATGTGSGDPLCQFGNSHVQSPTGLLTYNITTNRQVYDFFKNVTIETPAFNGSYIVFEGYSLEGMKAVEPDSTAFPHRADNILVYVAPLSSSLFEQRSQHGPLTDHLQRPNNRLFTQCFVGRCGHRVGQTGVANVPRWRRTGPPEEYLCQLCLWRRAD